MNRTRDALTLLVMVANAVGLFPQLALAAVIIIGGAALAAHRARRAQEQALPCVARESFLGFEKVDDRPR